MWAAPPMLLVDLRPLSAHKSGASVMGGWGSGIGGAMGGGEGGEGVMK